MSTSQDFQLDAVRDPPGGALARLRALEQALADGRIDLAGARRDAAGGATTALRCAVRGLGEVLLAGEIEEVLAAASTRALPEAPPWIVGVLELRGRIAPVIDLAAR